MLQRIKYFYTQTKIYQNYIYIYIFPSKIFPILQFFFELDKECEVGFDCNHSEYFNIKEKKQNNIHKNPNFIRYAKMDISKQLNTRIKTI